MRAAKTVTGLGLATALAFTACGPASETDGSTEAATGEATTETAAAPVDQVELHVFDCGTIEISDLDAFSMAGDYAGVADTFTNTCWLVRHPDGDLLWDTGLPGLLAGGPPQQNGVFTISLDRTLSDQLRERGVQPAEIETVSLSHSHFDHIGQIDQVAGATWLVHEKEHAAMFPDLAEDEAPPDAAAQFAAFEGFAREIFSGDHDVFGDGTVVILEMPGHTPGHTALQVNLAETGPVMLSGDLWHRVESRQLKRVPVFNTDVEGAEEPGAQTLASMARFERIAAETGAKVIIQHEPADIAPLPPVLR